MELWSFSGPAFRSFLLGMIPLVIFSAIGSALWYFSDHIAAKRGIPRGVLRSLAIVVAAFGIAVAVYIFWTGYAMRMTTLR